MQMPEVQLKKEDGVPPPFETKERKDKVMWWWKMAKKAKNEMDRLFLKGDPRWEDKFRRIAVLDSRITSEEFKYCRRCR